MKCLKIYERKNFIGFDGKVRTAKEHRLWVIQKTVELIPCSKCYVGPGTLCSTPSGEVLDMPHKKRLSMLRRYITMTQQKPHVFFYNRNWWCIFRGFSVIGENPEVALKNMKDAEDYYLGLHSTLNQREELVLLHLEIT